MTILLIEQLPIKTQLKIIDKWQSEALGNPDLTFEIWLCTKFNCSIIYCSDQFCYKGFNFFTEKDYIWFILRL